MRKAKYLLKRIFNLDYKNMFKIAKQISKKAKRAKFLILIDMVYCGFKYQAGYYDYQEFEFYNLNSHERKTYLTRGKNNEIIRKFNNKEFFEKFDNKILFNKLFEKYLKREWLYLDNNCEEFMSFFEKHNELIVKPIDSAGGKGIEKITYSTVQNAREQFSILVENNQLLVEEVIVQHRDMSKLYNDSVNTLRMFTFFNGSEAYCLQTILKIGNGSVVDNFSSGGMYTFADENGKVFVPAIDQKDSIYTEHPISKQKIVGFTIPMFEEAVNLVKECAKIIPQVAYVGWDIAITPDGPVIVEGNSFPGVFQPKPSLTESKIGIIPKYNEVMKIF